MLRPIRSLTIFLLSIAALIGIKALDLRVLLTILLVIPTVLVALISMLSFSIGKSPETREPKVRSGVKGGNIALGYLRNLCAIQLTPARRLFSGGYA